MLTFTGSQTSRQSFIAYSCRRRRSLRDDPRSRHMLLPPAGLEILLHSSEKASCQLEKGAVDESLPHQAPKDGQDMSSLLPLLQQQTRMLPPTPASSAPSPAGGAVGGVSLETSGHVRGRFRTPRMLPWKVKRSETGRRVETNKTDDVVNEYLCG